jgi:hypothetical protein
MEPVVISSGVTVIACIITGWISYLNTKKTIENNNEKIKVDILSQSSKTYKELITAERIKWLNEIRLLMAECISKANMIMVLRLVKNTISGECKDTNSFKDETNDFFEINAQNLRDFFTACYLIQFRLNPYQEDHGKILSHISKLENYMGALIGGGSLFKQEEFDVIGKEIEDMAASCQKLLKSEWELAKREAKGL